MDGVDSVGRRLEQRQEPRAAGCVIVSPVLTLKGLIVGVGTTQHT